MVRRRAVLGDGTRLGRAVLAAATVAVLAAAVLAVRSADDGRPGPEPATGPHASLTAGMSTEQLFAWGEQLPRGDDARVAYVVGGNTLVAGARRVDLGPGVQAELRAPPPGGWLAQLGGTDERGNWIDVRHGFLAVDGSFRPFSFEAPRHHARAGARRGGRAGRLPGRLRRHDRRCRHGTGGGDAARDAPGRHGLDRPDTLVDYGTRCSTLLRLDASGMPHPMDRSCGQGFPLVSGSGLQVTESGRVLHPGGQPLADLGLPVDPPTDGLDPPCCSLAWEDDDTLLVTLHLRREQDIAHVFVRCRPGRRPGQAVRSRGTARGGTPPRPSR